MKVLSEEWKNVSNVEKDKMQMMYEKAKKVYAKRMASIPDYEVEAAKMKKAGMRADKGAFKDQKEAKKELTVLLEALNKPKRPLRLELLSAVPNSILVYICTLAQLLPVVLPVREGEGVGQHKRKVAGREMVPGGREREGEIPGHGARGERQVRTNFGLQETVLTRSLPRYKEAMCAWEERMHSGGYTRQIAELTKRARG